MTRLDYDELAERYDEPSRDHVVDSILVEFSNTRPTTRDFDLRVLDIGCGTGKQLTADRRRFPQMTLVGIDRSWGMLQVARRRAPNVNWLQGDGATLPLDSGSFDYVTNQFSYPHIGRTGEFVQEVFRVLKPQGRFVMTNIDPWAMQDWFVYQFFPEAFTLDQRDFMQVSEFERYLREAGFVSISVEREDLTTEEDLADFQHQVSRAEQH